MRRVDWRCALFALPCGKEKAINDARLPGVEVAGGGELARIAGIDANFVRKVIIEPEVATLCVSRGQPVGRIGTIAKGLLYTEDGLEPADGAGRSAEV